MLTLNLTTHFNSHFKAGDIVPFSEGEKQPLGHLSKESLANLLNDYFYNDLTTDALLEKYEITMESPNRLQQFLPKVFTKLRCPYDNHKYQIELPSKTQFPFPQSPLFCRNCGHYDQDYLADPPTCDCHYCHRIKQSKQKRQEDLGDCF